MAKGTVSVKKKKPVVSVFECIVQAGLFLLLACSLHLFAVLDALSRGFADGQFTCEHRHAPVHGGTVYRVYACWE